jgi:hypothetical protein
MSSRPASRVPRAPLALFALGLGFGVWVWNAFGGAREPLALLPQSEGELAHEPRRWAALSGDASLPPEVRAAATYLEQRYGHLGDPGLALACASTGGSDVYVSAEPIAGVNGEGVPVYAIVYGRARRFEGRVHTSPPPSGGGLLYAPPLAASPPPADPSAPRVATPGAPLGD